MAVFAQSAREVTESEWQFTAGPIFPYHSRNTAIDGPAGRFDGIKPGRPLGRVLQTPTRILNSHINKTPNILVPAPEKQFSAPTNAQTKICKPQFSTALSLRCSPAQLSELRPVWPAGPPLSAHVSRAGSPLHRCRRNSSRRRRRHPPSRNNQNSSRRPPVLAAAHRASALMQRSLDTTRPHRAGGSASAPPT